MAKIETIEGAKTIEIIKGGTDIVTDLQCQECGIIERMRIQTPYRCRNCIEEVIEEKREQRREKEKEWQRQHPIKDWLGIKEKGL